MNIGIYIYDYAEVLDFSGPFEVFSTAKRIHNLDWNVFLVGEHAQLINARGHFKVMPDYSFEDHPKIDLLIVVGGVHTEEVKKKNVINWIKHNADCAIHVASVCTGAFLLAEAGLLDNRQVTTHWEDIPNLTKQYPKLKVIADQRWVADGKFTTSGGISAGIDMGLYLVSQLTSQEYARLTATQMEYRWE